MSLKGRGTAGSAARAARVLSRFGATASGMVRRLDRYDAITSEFDVRPTWPTTACVLARHPQLLAEYAERGAELALHGLVHGDHAVMEVDEQCESIAAAAGIFERCGLRPVGFRGPYLRYNAATLQALRALGLRYHCSQAVVFPVLDVDLPPAVRPGYELALQLYSALDARTVAVTPRLRDGLVDIPVAVPDDEILIERLGLHPDVRTAKWVAVLDLAYERGDIFTMQLHPERILELEDALRATLTDARRRQPAVWITRLQEIASWWLRRSAFSLEVVRSGDRRCRVRLHADLDATLIVRGLAVPRSPWHGRDEVSLHAEFEAESSRIPMVAISRRSPPAVRDFLTEEGFAIEVSDEREAYGAYVDVTAPDWSEVQVLEGIESSPGPLVRIWRWPSAARSALAITGDIDAVTLRDFLSRSWETRRPRRIGARA